jgi:hypothetical protein
MDRAKIKVMRGDKVRVEVTPYDLPAGGLSIGFGERRAIKIEAVRASPIQNQL